MSAHDYAWRVEVWDAHAGCWVLDGTASYAAGISRHCADTPEVAAGQLLRNWTAEPGSTATGRWRASVWHWEPGKSLGDPAALAELERES